jgi:hypothetical protein
MSTLLNNWHFMRVLRAAIAIWAFVEAGRTGEWVMLLPGIIFATQAIFDIGCCGAAGCATPQQFKQNDTENSREVVYEEVGK